MSIATAMFVTLHNSTATSCAWRSPWEAPAANSLATTSVGILFPFILMSLARIIRFSSYLLQITCDRCKSGICLEATVRREFQ